MTPKKNLIVMCERDRQINCVLTQFVKQIGDTKSSESSEFDLTAITDSAEKCICVPSTLRLASTAS